MPEARKQKTMYADPVKPGFLLTEGDIYMKIGADYDSTSSWLQWGEDNPPLKLRNS
jgi:hypothetical protein